MNMLVRQVNEHIGELPDSNVGVWGRLFGRSHFSTQAQRVSRYVVCEGKEKEILKEERIACMGKVTLACWDLDISHYGWSMGFERDKG